jgi:hypothetical protein
MLGTHERAEMKHHIINALLGLSAGEAWDKIEKKEASDFAAYLMLEIDNNEGYSLKICGNFFDEYVALNSPVIGQLVFDEMKLETGVFWRTSDHTVCGFASANQNSTIRSVLSDMLQNDSDGAEEFHDTSAPALYVNQWRFRSIYNVIHNSNFFFNSGSLDGNELLSQMMHVVCGYETIGVKIYGIVCDAGGSNRGLFKLLRNALKLGLVGVERVPPGYLKFINPYDPTREIAIFNCSTHNLKNVRNALLESDLPSGKRKFQFEGDQFLHLLQRTRQRLRRKVAKVDC